MSRIHHVTSWKYGICQNDSKTSWTIMISTLKNSKSSLCCKFDHNNAASTNFQDLFFKLANPKQFYSFILIHSAKNVVQMLTCGHPDTGSWLIDMKENTDINLKRKKQKKIIALTEKICTYKEKFI